MQKIRCNAKYRPAVFQKRQGFRMSELDPPVPEGIL